MAPTHVALLRGVNVGRAKRLAMADLRALVEELGYGEVRTLLNSGNVVFAAPGRARDAGRRIEGALAERLGLASRVVVLSRAELATVIAENPLLAVADDPSRLLVAVLADPAAGRRLLAPLVEQGWEPEALALGSRAAYVWMPTGVLDSPLMKALDRALRDGATARNWSTMLKLQALLAPS